jgi:hypothetical protein
VVLRADSRVEDLRARLKELGAPIYGDKKTLYARWLAAERKRARDIEVARALVEQRLQGEEAEGQAAPREMRAPGEPSEERGRGTC